MIDEWDQRDDNIVTGNMFVQIGGSDVEGEGSCAWPSCNLAFGGGERAASYELSVSQGSPRGA